MVTALLFSFKTLIFVVAAVFVSRIKRILLYFL